MCGGCDREGPDGWVAWQGGTHEGGGWREEQEEGCLCPPCGVPSAYLGSEEMGRV